MRRLLALLALLGTACSTGLFTTPCSCHLAAHARQAASALRVARASRCRSKDWRRQPAEPAAASSIPPQAIRPRWIRW